MTQMKHLSIVDGAFLQMENAEMPMHVGSLNLLEPPAGYRGEGCYETVKAHVASRMHLAPVFTRKLALMPFDLANPAKTATPAKSRTSRRPTLRVVAPSARAAKPRPEAAAR